MKTPIWAWTEQWGSHYSVVAQALKGLGLPASWEAERKPQQIGAFCLLPLMHHSKYCAVTALGRHYEIERRCRQSSEGGPWGEVLEKQNRIKTAAENGREDHRAEIELWDSEERQSPDKLNRETQSGFDFCSTHTRPSFLSFLLLCLRCFFDHTPSSSLFLAWDIHT